MGNYNNNGYNNGGYNNGYNNGGYNNGYNNGGYNNGYNGTTPPPFDNNGYYARNNAFDCDAMGKSRGIAGLLAILIGSLGIQYFYLGKTTAGIITIVISLVSCGLWGLIMLIQGIMLLVMSNEEFDRKFVYSKSSFPVF